MSADLATLSVRLRRALRPLDDPPRAPGWNHEELHDLLDDSSRRPAAVLVAVIERDAGPAILFTQRNDDLPNHGGQVSFPGGGMDALDRDAVATALRETREEVGIPAHLIRPLGFLDCFETISGYCVTPVVAELDRNYEALPDPREVADVFEAPLAFFLDASNLTRRRINYRGRAREIIEFFPDGRTVWGATAAMLHSLAKRMEDIA